ncbi:hypothetical protein B0H13DRAFT_2427526 [Mycena leptocephala]|nr:hypothetical protein B0H13DRAFT_2427526 [Mycena leptocephala]
MYGVPPSYGVWTDAKAKSQECTGADAKSKSALDRQSWETDGDRGTGERSFPIHLAAILFLHCSAITRAPIQFSKAFRQRMARPVVSSRVNLVARHCALKQRIHDWVFATRFDELVTKIDKWHDILFRMDGWNARTKIFNSFDVDRPPGGCVPARRAIDLSDVPPVLENPVGDVFWLLIVVAQLKSGRNLKFIDRTQVVGET